MSDMLVKARAVRNGCGGGGGLFAMARKLGLHMNACVALAACGLGLNLVWCTLMGHTLGFLSSASGMEDWMNPRLFFLAGILASSLAFALAPRALRHADGVLRFVLPLLAAFGTACFGLSYHQTFFDASALAVGGLFVAGACYFWLVARFVLLLVRAQGQTCTVAAVAGGLVVKLPVLLLLTACVDPGGQVVAAMAAPLASAFAFEGAVAAARAGSGGGEGSARQEVPRVRTVFGVPSRPRPPASSVADRRAMAILLATAAVVLAVIRSVSYLGMWGDTNANISADLPWFTGVALPAGCVALFAWAALVRMADSALAVRFQPALLLILAGLFVVAIQANPTAEPLRFLTGVIQIDELLAHLLFWAVVACALDVLDVSPYRVMGAACFVYALTSVAWVLLLSRAAIVDTLLVMLATYALVVAALCATWFAGRRDGEAVCRAGEASPLSETVADTCSEIARRYGLSPRETEVFTLLAQGRTRAFIQEELVLSGGTVKTHVTHIYAKMGVHDRQEMMDLIWK